MTGGRTTDLLCGAWAPPGSTRAPWPAAFAGATRMERNGVEARCLAVAGEGRARAVDTPDGWLLCVGAPHRGGASRDLADAFSRLVRGDRTVLADLGGEFALVCWQRGGNRLLVATDPFGSIPLFHARIDGQWVFSTDLPWLANQLPRRELEPQALYDYLFYAVVPGCESIWRGVAKLPPASAAVTGPAGIDVTPTWRPDFARATRVSHADLRERTRASIDAAVARVAALPDRACFLSGGLDSSTVCGYAAAHADEPVPAFTIGFDVDDYDESHYARVSATHFGLELHERRIRSADVSDCLDDLVGSFPEPFGNASAVPAYLCARFAREHGVRNLLAGDGGDELYAGNERYQKQALFNTYGDLPALVRRGVVDPLAALGGRLPGPGRKLASYVAQARVPLPDRLFAYNLLVRNAPSTVLTPEFLRRVDPQGPYDYARRVWREPAHGDALDRMLYLDWQVTLTDNDLPKVRMGCDLAGVAVHFPMLDPGVVAASAAVPSRAKLTLRELRKFYKEAFAGFLPDEVIHKKKHGFGVPVGIWITRDPVLRDRVHDALQALARRGIVQPSFIDELLRLHRTEHAVYYGALVWTLFVLELWLARNAG